jgi:hypothetical protein
VLSGAISWLGSIPTKGPGQPSIPRSTGTKKRLRRCVRSMLSSLQALGERSTTSSLRWPGCIPAATATAARAAWAYPSSCSRRSPRPRCAWPARDKPNDGETQPRAARADLHSVRTRCRPNRRVRLRPPPTTVAGCHTAWSPTPTASLGMGPHLDSSSVELGNAPSSIAMTSCSRRSSIFATSQPRWRPPSCSFTGWTAASRTSVPPEALPGSRFARHRRWAAPPARMPPVSHPPHRSASAPGPACGLLPLGSIRGHGVAPICDDRRPVRSGRHPDDRRGGPSDLGSSSPVSGTWFRALVFRSFR